MEKEIKQWNSFIENFIEAKKAWGRLQESLNSLESKALESYPIQAQRHLSKGRNVKFEWWLPMLGDYVRGVGGWEELLVEVPKEVKEKEKEKKDDSKKG